MSPCTLRLELKNAQSETERLCRCVEDFATSTGLDKKTAFRITLALEELFTNIVSYGFQDGLEHTIGITLEKENRALVFRIEDDGVPFDPMNAEAPDVKCPLEESKVGGLGIHLVKKMMDEIVYERRDDKNIITMKKFIMTG